MKKKHVLTFFLTIVCCIFFNTFACQNSTETSLTSGERTHHTFRLAQEILLETNKENYNFTAPFLDSLSLNPTTPLSPETYAVTCGDINGEPNTFLCDNATKRAQLKKVASEIIYLKIKSLGNNLYLSKKSECEKLLNNINSNNNFAIVFNAKDHSSNLLVLHATKDGKIFGTTSHAIPCMNEKIDQSSHNIEFLKIILNNETERNNAISTHMYSKFANPIAQSELNRLGIIEYSSYLSKLLQICTITNLSYLLVGYIIVALCYKAHYQIPIIVMPSLT